MDFSFLKSNRFWALIIAGLAVASEGNFIKDAWIKGLLVVIGGFVSVRTVDRFGDKVETK
jgi:hypothetical protein